MKNGIGNVLYCGKVIKSPLYVCGNYIHKTRNNGKKASKHYILTDGEFSPDGCNKNTKQVDRKSVAQYINRNDGYNRHVYDNAILVLQNEKMYSFERDDCGILHLRSQETHRLDDDLRDDILKPGAMSHILVVGNTFDVPNLYNYQFWYQGTEFRVNKDTVNELDKKTLCDLLANLTGSKLYTKWKYQHPYSHGVCALEEASESERADMISIVSYELVLKGC